MSSPMDGLARCLASRAAIAGRSAGYPSGGSAREGRAPGPRCRTFSATIEAGGRWKARAARGGRELRREAGGKRTRGRSAPPRREGPGLDDECDRPRRQWDGRGLRARRPGARLRHVGRGRCVGHRAGANQVFEARNRRRGMSTSGSGRSRRDQAHRRERQEPSGHRPEPSPRWPAAHPDASPECHTEH